MRKLILAVALGAVIGAPGAAASEVSVDPHATVYLRIPFGAGNADARRPFMGLRLDQARVGRTGLVDHGALYARPANLDLRISGRGFEDLRAAGQSVVRRDRALNASEGDDDMFWGVPKSAWALMIMGGAGVYIATQVFNSRD